MKTCSWCGNEIEIDNGDIEIDEMHEICHQACIRENQIADSVEKDYDPQQ